MKKTVHIVLSVFLLGFCSPRAKAQRILHFPFNEISGSQTTTESISGNTYFIHNNFEKPERITGVDGNALRLDGWSTWIEKEMITLPAITRTFSLECWYATESFTAANAGLVSQEDPSSGFSLEVEPYGKLVFIFHADNSRYVMVTDRRLTKYAWNHIVATVDLNTRLAVLYVNGEIWKSIFLEEHEAKQLSTNTLYIGRDTDMQLFADFPLTMANGALDEVSIYQNVLSEAEVRNRYEAHAGIPVDLFIDPAVRHGNDFLRPQFHPMPSTSWTNECYGLTYHNGKYHLFFQKNPNGPYLYFMHWGHLTSDDLVSWKEEKIALAPEPGFDHHGVWSGTTVKDPNDTPVMVYTGVDGAKAGMGIAYPADPDLEHWERSASNPVVVAAPEDIKNLDFRDPFVWRADDMYYMIVGSGLQFGGGGYLFTYKSADLVSWTRIGTLYNDSNTTRSGTFWEMPFFYKLTDEDWILSVTPAPANGVRARSIYWIGSFSGGKFIPYDADPKQLELINENLLAPAVSTDEAGRFVYIGIIPEDRNVEDQIKAGWRHIFSIPRSVRLLQDSTIGQIPHPNLCRLRGEKVSIENRKISTGTSFNLPEISGNQHEMLFSIKADSAARFAIHIFKNEDETEYTSLYFDLSANKIKLDRSKSSLSNTTKDIQESTYVFDHQEPIHVNIFIDHSVLEVFLDNVVVFSCRVYPSRRSSNNVDLIVEDKTVEIRTLDFWKMKSMTASFEDLVCEPAIANLPVALRKAPEPDPVLDAEKSIRTGGVWIYPNPASSQIVFEFQNEVKPRNFRFSVFSSEGKLISQDIIQPDVNHISVGDLKAGLYFGRIEYNGRITVVKLLIRR